MHFSVRLARKIKTSTQKKKKKKIRRSLFLSLISTFHFTFQAFFGLQPQQFLRLPLSSLIHYVSINVISFILKSFRFVWWNKIFQYRLILMYRFRIFRIYIYIYIHRTFIIFFLNTFIIVLHELCYFPQHFMVVINLL